MISIEKKLALDRALPDPIDYEAATAREPKLPDNALDRVLDLRKDLVRMIALKDESEVPAQGRLFHDGMEAEQARHDEWEVWRTPLAVALQPMRFIVDRAMLPWRPEPLRILDPSAGCGVFGVAARQTWGSAHLTAIEPREEERPALEARYNRVITSRFEDVELDDAFDLIITNPAFGSWGDLWQSMIGLLAPQGLLVLYLPSTMGHSDEPAERGDIFDRYPPVAQLRVMGRVAHRTGVNLETGKKYGRDNRKHSFWVWRQSLGIRRGPWRTHNLPRLAPHELIYRPIGATT